MRFDTTRGVSAADLVNTLPEAELADVLWRYGEERRSRAIARRIGEARQRQPITRTSELARLVASVVHRRPGGIHPATRAFQALRIAVNDELASLEAALPAAIELLRPGGRLAVISFHSLEDRIVKQTFQREERGCLPAGTPGMCLRAGATAAQRDPPSVDGECGRDRDESTRSERQAAGRGNRLSRESLGGMGG